MKKILLLAIVISGLKYTAWTREIQPDFFHPEYIRSVMRKVAQWQFDHPKNRVTNEWTNAVLYSGVFAAWKTTQDQFMYDALMSMGNKNNWMPYKRFYHADDLAISQTYIDLYRIEKKPEMIQPTIDTLERFISQPYPTRGIEVIKWWWVDALFMAPTVLVKLGKTLNKPEYLNYSDQYFRECYDLLYNKKDRLFARDLAYTIKNNSSDRYETNDKPIYWSRGNGWALAGLARILDELPSNYPKRKFYETLFKEMSAKIISLQQSNGQWKPGLLNPDGYPNGETSGTALFCYALAWGVNNKILSPEKYTPAIKKAWLALNNCVNDDGMVGWVQPIGNNPNANLTANSWELYGTGAFLLCGSEVIKMVNN